MAMRRRRARAALRQGWKSLCGGYGATPGVGRSWRRDGYRGAWCREAAAGTLRPMHHGGIASTRQRGPYVKDPGLRFAHGEAASEALNLDPRADRDEAFDWVMALSGSTGDREEAIADLYALLLRGARFEFGRRRASLPDVGRAEEADLATQAADDALVAILAKLDTFRGAKSPLTMRRGPRSPIPAPPRTRSSSKRSSCGRSGTLCRRRSRLGSARCSPRSL